MKEVLIISAVWCPSCLILNKNLKKLTKEYPDLKITKLDYDLDEEEIQEYNIGTKLPIMIIKQDNKEIDRLVGEKKYEEIVEFLTKNNL